MQASEEIARLFNDSYERVVNTSAEMRHEFFDRFYVRFLEKSPEAARKFEHMDMRSQVRMLQASVALFVAYYAEGFANPVLERVAERHGETGANIHRDLYPVWLEALIETVRAHDPKCDDRVEEAWRAVFSKGIEFMMAHSSPP